MDRFIFFCMYFAIGNSQLKVVIENRIAKSTLRRFAQIERMNEASRRKFMLHKSEWCLVYTRIRYSNDC